MPLSREGHARTQDSIPPDQRRVRVDRGDLDRFLFAPDDVIVIVLGLAAYGLFAMVLHQRWIGVAPFG